MTRPAGWVKGFSKSCDPGRIPFLNLAGRVGTGQEDSKSSGSGGVWSKGLISRVGSGHAPRDAGHSRVKPS